MQKKRGIQFFFAILIGWWHYSAFLQGTHMPHRRKQMRRCRWMFPMDLINTAKSDRYLRVTVLLNNDTRRLRDAGVS